MISFNINGGIVFNIAFDAVRGRGQRLMDTGTLIGIIVMALVVIGCFASSYKKEKEKLMAKQYEEARKAKLQAEKAEKEAKERAEKEEQQRLKNIVKAFREMNIDSLQGDERNEALQLLAKNYNLSGPDEVISLVKRGEKKIYDDFLEQEKKVQREKQAQVDRSNHNPNKWDWSTRTPVGKAWYLKQWENRIEQASKKINEAKGIAEADKGPLQLNSKGVNSYVVGGLASGVGGPIAGAVAYSNNEREKAKTQAANNEFNAVMRHQWAAQAAKNQQTIREEQAKIERYNKAINEINEWIVDSDHTQDWFEKANFKVTKMEIMQDSFCMDGKEYKGYNYIIATVRFNNDLSMFNKAVCLDGIIKITLMDGDKPIGCGKLQGGYIDRITSYNYHIYFEWPLEGVQKGEWRLDGNCRTAICCYCYEDFDSAKIDQYTVKIEPIELWAVSNSKITEKSIGNKNESVQKPEINRTVAINTETPKTIENPEPRILEVLRKSGRPMTIAEIEEADPALNELPKVRIWGALGKLVGKERIEKIAISGEWHYKIKK